MLFEGCERSAASQSSKRPPRRAPRHILKTYPSEATWAGLRKSREVMGMQARAGAGLSGEVVNMSRSIFFVVDWFVVFSGGREAADVPRGPW
mmetsp:Transcript_2791/g.4364  ORF Transcript_2791/g.4364 Transcript_2791/m.4364 type:complete len:92 (-) Transcript_2791:85-360(-)